jgi:hypothetical protein
MSNLTHVDYVNLNGETVANDARNPSWHTPKKREPKIAQSFHKGFRVEGINEQMIADAEKKREQQIAEAQSKNAKPEYASRPVKCPPPIQPGRIPALRQKAADSEKAIRHRVKRKAVRRACTEKRLGCCACGGDVF